MDKRSKERREDKIPREGKEMQGDWIFFFFLMIRLEERERKEKRRNRFPVE